MSRPIIELPSSRREFLANSGAGFGAVALAGMLGDSSGAKSATRASSEREPHFRPRAKRVIFLFMEGGPSHIDMFDPKPLLNELHGQKLPDSFGEVITAMGESRSPLLA